MVIEEHEALLDVVLRRDAEAARDLMYEHIGAAIALMSEAMSQRDGEPVALQA